MADKSIILNEKEIKSKIYTIRGLQVMLDVDLADLFGVVTKRLNEQVKRNKFRFPNNFMFQLNDFEKNELVAKCDQLKNLKFSSTNPYVFTEQGVAMLSGVLKSEIAIKISIQIMDAFVAMRRIITSGIQINQRLDNIEQKQIEYDKKFEEVFDAIQSKEIKPEKGIFYDGQIFDAYKFVLDLIRGANTSIILIDNYIDDSVLTMLSKRNKGVDVIIFTKEISKQLSLNLVKYNKNLLSDVLHILFIRKFLELKIST